MRRIADAAAYFFIFSVVVCSGISIFGIWDFFDGDVIGKSFLTIGLLALVAIIVMIADHFIDQRGAAVVGTGAPAELSPAQQMALSESSVIFKGIRTFTIAVLVCALAILALLGVMAIWEIVSGEFLHKSLASIGLIAFSSLIVVVTCLEREGGEVLRKRKISGGMIVLIIIIAWFLIPALFDLMMY